MVGDKANIEWSYTISHNIRTRVFDEASKRLTQNLLKNSSFLLFTSSELLELAVTRGYGSRQYHQIQRDNRKVHRQ